MNNSESIKKINIEFLEALIKHAVYAAKELEKFDSEGFYSNHVCRLVSAGEDLISEAKKLDFGGGQ